MKVNVNTIAFQELAEIFKWSFFRTDIASLNTIHSEERYTLKCMLE